MSVTKVEKKTPVLIPFVIFSSKPPHLLVQSYRCWILRCCSLGKPTGSIAQSIQSFISREPNPPSKTRARVWQTETRKNIRLFAENFPNLTLLSRFSPVEKDVQQRIASLHYFKQRFLMLCLHRTFSLEHLRCQRRPSEVFGKAIVQVGLPLSCY